MTAPDRARVLLRGGPWGGSLLWADDMAATARAARRYRPGHPAAELGQYEATSEVDEGVIAHRSDGQVVVVRAPGAVVWRYVEPDWRPGPPGPGDPDLVTSAGDVRRGER